MTRLLLTAPIALLVACSAQEPSAEAVLAATPAPLVAVQGGQLQGGQLQGGQLQGDVLGGAAGNEEPLLHTYAGMTLEGHPLSAVRIERGGLVAVRGSGSSLNSRQVTLRGAQLVGAQLQAVTAKGSIRRHRIATVRAEGDDSFLYGLEQQAEDGTWTPWCNADAQGVAEALPVAATFDARGNRAESTTHFTFGCTSGALAKCARWGYTPWGTPELHWACTRLARADYCGDGTPHTRDGTLINVWDTLPTPIQAHGEGMPGMLFEAGWSTRGAVCLSKQRWLTLSPDVAAACPDRLIAPGVGVGTATVCEDPLQARAFGSVQLFNESQLNVQ